MVLKIKTFLLALLIFLIPFSSCLVEDFKDGMDDNHSLYKAGVQMSMRKLLMLEMHDYDDPSANTKHEPKKKPGNGKP